LKVTYSFHLELFEQGVFKCRLLFDDESLLICFVDSRSQRKAHREQARGLRSGVATCCTVTIFKI